MEKPKQINYILCCFLCVFNYNLVINQSPCNTSLNILLLVDVQCMFSYCTVMTRYIVIVCVVIISMKQCTMHTTYNVHTLYM